MAVKVCQLCAVDFTLQHFLLPLIDGMLEAGWEVTSVCSDGAAIPELRARGYRIETVPIARSLNPFRHPSSVLAMVRLFRRERFDVVHVHTPVAALLGRIAAKIAGVPLVIYTAHGFYFHDDMSGWKRKIFVMMERFGGRLTDLLFTQSAEDVEAAVNENIVAARQVLAIGNGVDVMKFDPVKIGAQRQLRRALGVPDDAFLVGMVCRLVREKGVVEFLEAAITLGGRDKRCCFVLIGEKLASDHASDVAAEIERAKMVLGSRLVLTGLRRDIPELLAVMDAFCLPSWREGMPRTIIEAMMMSRPVVATDIRGAREEVVPEQTGLLVPVRSPDHLAAAIGRLVADPSWAARLGTAGRERALLLYDERSIVAVQVEKIGEALMQRNLLRQAQ